MSLVETVQHDLVTALKAKDGATVSALRGLKAALQKAAIEEHGSLSDERAFAVLKKEIKQREDSIATYSQAGRADLAESEQAERDVLQKYQPAQLSEDEVRTIITEVVAAADKKEFGPLMGQVMTRVQGQADGKLVQTLLKEVLATQA